MPEIEATLHGGRSVVCDRYWGSGYAYGTTDGLDPEYMLKIHRYLPAPTLTILIDVPTEVAVERLKARGAPTERYEKNRDYMARIADRYRELWARNAHDPSWVVVDGAGTPGETQAKLVRHIKPEMMSGMTFLR
jgi:dTMP kinase